MKTMDDIISETEAEQEAELRKCREQGRCYIIQDTIYNPYDKQGMDLLCRIHDCKFKLKTEHGDWGPEIPQLCPKGEKNKLI